MFSGQSCLSLFASWICRWAAIGGVDHVRPCLLRSRRREAVEELVEQDILIGEIVEEHAAVESERAAAVDELAAVEEEAAELEELSRRVAVEVIAQNMAAGTIQWRWR